LADSGNLYLVFADEAEGVFKRAEMAEGRHFINQEQPAQSFRPLKRAQRRDDHKAQPYTMCPQPFGGQ
jgi:hypothetical protein